MQLAYLIGDLSITDPEMLVRELLLPSHIIRAGPRLTATSRKLPGSYPGDWPKGCSDNYMGIPSEKKNYMHGHHHLPTSVLSRRRAYIIISCISKIFLV